MRKEKFNLFGISIERPTDEFGGSCTLCLCRGLFGRGSRSFIAFEVIRICLAICCFCLILSRFQFAFRLNEMASVSAHCVQADIEHQLHVS